MLTKMGWSEGHGLGSTLQGETSHVKVKKKKHGHGINFSHSVLYHHLLNYTL